MSIESLSKVVKRCLHCTEELVSAHLGSPELGSDLLRAKAVAHKDSQSARAKEWGRWMFRMNSGAGDAQKAASARAWLSVHIEKGDFLERVRLLLAVACDQVDVVYANPLEPRCVVLWSCGPSASVTDSPAAMMRCFPCGPICLRCCISLLRITTWCRATRS